MPSIEEPHVCVVDFAGNSRQPGMWADYWPARKVTTFGGYWRPVPDMPSERQPGEDEVEAWAKQHEEKCKAAYEAWLENGA